MATSLNVNCSWKENTFHKGAMRRVLIFTKKGEEERGVRINSFKVCTLTDPLKCIWSKLWVSNFNSSCFFIKLWYPPINVDFSYLWTIHEIQIKFNNGLAMQKCYILCFTHWEIFYIYMTYSMIAISRDDKVRTSLVVQWLRLHTSTIGGTGSVLGWGTKNLHATRRSQQLKKKRAITKFTVDFLKNENIKWQWIRIAMT